MSDIDQILGAEQPQEQPQVEETPQVVDQEQPEETPEEPVADVAPPAEPQQVPLAALQETRAEVKALKAQLAQQQPQQPAMPPPDFIDPEGAQYMQSAFQQQLSHVTAEMSEKMARLEHKELVDEAYQAAQQQGIVDQFRGGQDPWGKLVAWYNQQRVLSEVGNSPEAYRAKIEAEVRAKVEAEMVARQAKAQATVPSLAGATSSTSPGTAQGFNPTSLDNILG